MLVTFPGKCEKQEVQNTGDREHQGLNIDNLDFSCNGWLSHSKVTTEDKLWRRLYSVGTAMARYNSLDEQSFGLAPNFN